MLPNIVEQLTNELAQLLSFDFQVFHVHGSSSEKECHRDKGGTFCPIIQQVNTELFSPFFDTFQFPVCDVPNGGDVVLDLIKVEEAGHGLAFFLPHFPLVHHQRRSQESSHIGDETFMLDIRFGSFSVIKFFNQFRADE